MNNHIQISFTNLQPERSEILIAQLSEAGFEGFEEGDQELKAFISEKKYDKKLVHEILYKYQVDFTEQIIPEQNWNAVWESNFQPVIIDDFVAIRAHFHRAFSNVEHDIMITPKMSFGTGHHATTYMMVQQMRKINFSHKNVLDFGTGTGILAILAEKLGASNIIATDNDTWSISNATENIRLNHCNHVIIEQSSSVPGGAFDIILANINKNVILDNFSTIAGQLSPQGILLISGVLIEDIGEMIVAAGRFSLKLKEETSKNNWVCLRFEY